MSKYREWNFKLSAKRTSVNQQSKREFQSEIQAAKIYHVSANPVCIYLMTMAWVPGNLQKTWNHKMVDNIQGVTWLWREHKTQEKMTCGNVQWINWRNMRRLTAVLSGFQQATLCPEIFYPNTIEGRSLMKVCTAYNQLYPNIGKVR